MQPLPIHKCVALSADRAIILTRGRNAVTREESLFLAKKLYVELVYNTAYIEGVNVTFPQTQTIIDGGIVNNVAVGDIQTVLNLRDGWKFVLANIDTPITLEFVCKINEYVSRNESLEWGVLRTGTVGISGTDYEPKTPDTEGVIAEFGRIGQILDPQSRALEYFCYTVRSQLFWDGNKRTSTMLASKVLIENGIGILTIDAKHALQFNEGLLHYYNTSDATPLQNALKACIKSLDMQKKPSMHDRLESAKTGVELREQTKSNVTHKFDKHTHIG